MIPKNTMLRNNIKKIIKGHCPEYLEDIKKMNVDDFQGPYHVSRRLNQMIKKRTNSMLAGSSINLEEVGDLLGLIEERLILEGHDLNDAINQHRALINQYGDYSKHYTSTSSIDLDCKIFLPYVDRGKIVTDGDYVSRKSRIQDGKEY